MEGDTPSPHASTPFERLRRHAWSSSAGSRRYGPSFTASAKELSANDVSDRALRRSHEHYMSAASPERPCGTPWQRRQQRIHDRRDGTVDGRAHSWEAHLSDTARQGFNVAALARGDQRARRGLRTHDAHAYGFAPRWSGSQQALLKEVSPRQRFCDVLERFERFRLSDQEDARAAGVLRPSSAAIGFTAKAPTRRGRQADAERGEARPRSDRGVDAYGARNGMDLGESRGFDAEGSHVRHGLRARPRRSAAQISGKKHPQRGEQRQSAKSRHAGVRGAKRRAWR